MTNSERQTGDDIIDLTEDVPPTGDESFLDDLHALGIEVERHQLDEHWVRYVIKGSDNELRCQDQYVGPVALLGSMTELVTRSYELAEEDGAVRLDHRSDAAS